MASKKKGPRQVIKLRSTESSHTYTTVKNRRNDPARLELRSCPTRPSTSERRASRSDGRRDNPAL